MKTLYPIATLLILLSLACGVSTPPEQEECFSKISWSPYIQASLNISSLEEAWGYCQEESNQNEVKQIWEDIPPNLKMK